MQRSASRLLVPILLAFVCACQAIAQVPTGGVRGIIKDQSEAVIAGANVTLTNKGTGLERTFVSRSSGEYAISNLPPGDYEVKVTKEGFKTALIPVTIQVGDNLTVDVPLEVGRASETVVITGETPAINTTDYKVDGVVNRKQIDNLPLNGRNFLQLAMLEPGVTVEAVDNPGTSPNNFFRVSIAGASQALTRISVDGATINDRVTGGTSQNFSQESVQEFQISTFNHDITTSITGVGSVNVVSRSGTNQFHGSAFIYYRDHNMSAFPALQRNPRRFIDPSLDDPFFARRQMGGSIGGPIKKDKVHFFLNYEYQNQDGIQPVANNHPVFSQFDTSPANPLTFQQWNGKLDWQVTNKNHAFVRLSSDSNDNYNSANGTFMPSNWVVTVNRSYQALGSLTTVFTPRITNDLRFSYGFYSGRLNIPTTSDCTTPIYCLGLGGARLSTTASSFVVGNNLNTPQNRVLRTYQIVDNVSVRKGNHGMRFGGEFEHHYGVGHWAYLEPAFVTLWDPLTMLLVVDGTGGNASPFKPLYDALPNSLKVNATRTGPLVPGLLPTYSDILKLPLAGYATGIGDPGQPQPYNVDEAARNNRYRAYFSDAWQINSRFTLTYGLAYSIEDKLMNHDLDRPAYLSALLGGNLAAPKVDKNNWDPSVGFAWNVTGNGKTVIRGGAGIFHDSNLFWTRLVERAYTGPSGNGRYIIPGTAVNIPGYNPILSTSVPTQFSGQNLIDVLPTVRSQLQAFVGTGTDLSVRGVEKVKSSGDRGFGGIYDPNTVTPYSMNVSAGFQREMTQNLVLQADFVMRRSVHFGPLHDTMIWDRNRFTRASLSQVDPITGRGNSITNPVIPRCVGNQSLDPKAYCSLGAINVGQSGANFRYTGLHIKLDRRFSKSYLFTGSYALSKYTGHNGIINYDNLDEADGYQGADRTHKITFSGLWELPQYGGDNGFVKALANRWSTSLIWQWQSSPALTMNIGGVDLNGDGTDTLMLPGTTYRTFGRDVTPAELQNLIFQYNQTYPTAVTGKRTTRDQVIPVVNLPAGFDNGDTFNSIDIRVTRFIRFTESANLQLIGEVFNVFNVSNLSGYNGTLTSANYGLPSTRVGGVFGTGGPRAFQVAAKFTF